MPPPLPKELPRQAIFESLPSGFFAPSNNPNAFASIGPLETAFFGSYSFDYGFCRFDKNSLGFDFTASVGVSFLRVSSMTCGARLKGLDGFGIGVVGLYGD